MQLASGVTRFLHLGWGRIDVGRGGVLKVSLNAAGAVQRRAPAPRFMESSLVQMITPWNHEPGGQADQIKIKIKIKIKSPYLPTPDSQLLSAVHGKLDDSPITP